MSERRPSLRTVNRAIILIAIASILAGLLLGQERETFVNAVLLCISCIGLG